MYRLYFLIANVLSVGVALVLLNGARLKLLGDAATSALFAKLDSWAGYRGVGGLFSETGLLSPYVVGGLELIAAIFLLLGIFPFIRRVQVLGAWIALTLMLGLFAVYVNLSMTAQSDLVSNQTLLIAAAAGLAILLILLLRRETARWLAGDMLRAVFMP